MYPKANYNKIGQWYRKSYIRGVIVISIFGNYTGHIWGTSQRAWMGEDVELERGRSDNISLIMTKNRENKKH